MDDDDDGESTAGLFTEPEGYYPPSPKPTTAEHTLLDGSTLTVSLIGHSPLWGHHLWNGGRIVSNYLEEHASSMVEGKDVLELGAGAGVPSLVCALRGARTVVVTDYPDQELVENIRKNVSSLVEEHKIAGSVHVEGYLWGSPVDPLTAHLPKAISPKSELQPGFDTLILADLLFNHSEHGKLVQTIKQSLSHKATSRALVFFTPYRPWLIDKDLNFFDLAKEEGLAVVKVLEMEMNKVMFENDRGDEKVRRTVYGYELSWPGP